MPLFKPNIKEQPTKYAYEDMGDDQFEKLIVILCQQILGISVKGFAKGTDGGRDAKFVGTAQLIPSENLKKDTHNLGKTTLGRLLDFCLLAGRDKNLFLFKHLEVFNEFVFFLEIELSDGTYLTVRRSVKNASKVSFKKHADAKQNYSKLTNAEWDHIDIPFETARTILDSLLDFRTLKPWTFRNSLGYLLRSQDEYRDIFELRFTKR